MPITKLVYGSNRAYHEDRNLIESSRGYHEDDGWLEKWQFEITLILLFSLFIIYYFYFIVLLWRFEHVEPITKMAAQSNRLENRCHVIGAHI